MSRGSLLALPVLIAATAVAAAAATENAADGGAAMMPLTAAAEEGACLPPESPECLDGAVLDGTSSRRALLELLVGRRRAQLVELTREATEEKRRRRQRIRGSEPDSGQWDRRIRLSKRSVPDSAYDGDVGGGGDDEGDDDEFYPPAALSVADLARLWQIQQQQRDSQMRRRLYGSGGADGYSGVVLRPGADKRGYIRINKRGYIRINKRGHIRIVK